MSTRVHSSYHRRLADLPVAGQPTELRLRVRRFFCDQVAGRAGSMLATALGVPVSRSTLLRRIRGLPDQPVGAVAVLGGEVQWSFPQGALVEIVGGFGSNPKIMVTTASCGHGKRGRDGRGGLDEGTFGP